jgi:hypothetical protein
MQCNAIAKEMHSPGFDALCAALPCQKRELRDGQIVGRIQSEKVEAVSAGKAYNSNAVREAFAKAGKEVVIPWRST